MSSWTVCRGWFRGAVQLSVSSREIYQRIPVYCLKPLAACINYFYLHWAIWYAESIILINSYNRTSTFDSCFLNLIISGKYFRFGYICSRSWTTFKGFEIYISNHPWLVSSHLISQFKIILSLRKIFTVCTIIKELKLKLTCLLISDKLFIF